MTVKLEPYPVFNGPTPPRLLPCGCGVVELTESCFLQLEFNPSCEFVASLKNRKIGLVSKVEGNTVSRLAHDTFQLTDPTRLKILAAIEKYPDLADILHASYEDLETFFSNSTFEHLLGFEIIVSALVNGSLSLKLLHSAGGGGKNRLSVEAVVHELGTIVKSTSLSLADLLAFEGDGPCALFVMQEISPLAFMEFCRKLASANHSKRTWILESMRKTGPHLAQLETKNRRLDFLALFGHFAFENSWKLIADPKFYFLYANPALNLEEVFKLAHHLDTLSSEHLELAKNYQLGMKGIRFLQKNRICFEDVGRGMRLPARLLNDAAAHKWVVARLAKLPELQAELFSLDHREERALLQEGTRFAIDLGLISLEEFKQCNKWVKTCLCLPALHTAVKDGYLSYYEVKGIPAGCNVHKLLSLSKKALICVLERYKAGLLSFDELVNLSLSSISLLQYEEVQNYASESENNFKKVQKASFVANQALRTSAVKEALARGTIDLSFILGLNSLDEITRFLKPDSPACEWILQKIDENPELKDQILHLRPVAAELFSVKTIRNAIDQGDLRFIDVLNMPDKYLDGAIVINSKPMVSFFKAGKIRPLTVLQKLPLFGAWRPFLTTIKPLEGEQAPSKNYPLAYLSMRINRKPEDLDTILSIKPLALAALQHKLVVKHCFENADFLIDMNERMTFRGLEAIQIPDFQEAFQNGVLLLEDILFMPEGSGLPRAYNENPFLFSKVIAALTKGSGVKQRLLSLSAKSLSLTS
jgi:hypothetical protein